MSQEEEVGIDLEEIGEKYEEKGFFRRLADMSSGLKQPHDTREYKLARIELQRLAAPLIAIVTVAMFVVVLIVVTAIQAQKKEIVEVQIAEIEEDETTLEETPEEEPPPDDIEPPIEDVEIMVDTTNPGPVSQLTPVAGPPSEQVTVKPAQADTVAFVDSPVKMKSMVGSRTPGSIGAATKGGDGSLGDPTTEAAVMKVLWYLKSHQSSDGSWKGGQCPLANTALATLSFLAHGEYPGSPSPYEKDFGPVVQMAVEYLCSQVNDEKTPVTMRGADGNEYAFLIATYALCEAFGMTKNANCKDKAFACLDRIVKGQSPTGGWDYKINPSSSRDDVSFAGWALQALKAGKMAGLHPEGLDDCIKKAIHGLKTRNYKDGYFKYCAESDQNHGLAATGCLAMQLLGYGSQPEVAGALDYMRDWQPAFDKSQLSQRNEGVAPQYYCYYATQCKYQAGMKPGATKTDLETWQKWNLAMKKLYPKSIIDDGTTPDWSGKQHKQGHFENTDTHTSRPIMDTCLAALQLMVYYRYLPTTQTKNMTEDAGADGAEAAVDKGNDVTVDVDI